MGMMIPGRSCSAEGVVRRVAVGPSRSEIAPLHFSVAIAGSASAGIAAYHGTRIADAIVIAAAARQLESQLTTTFAAHALGRGPARRYAIYGSAARGGRKTRAERGRARISWRERMCTGAWLPASLFDHTVPCGFAIREFSRM